MNGSDLLYSIVIPVFNKAALTRHCLQTLPPTLEGAGEGEVIVIDNASSDETPQMLAEFPWIRVVRNERNLGFAGANNQGARLARGRFLVLLNNDTEARPGWLASMLRSAADPAVGAVGARLLFPNGTIQHAGVVNFANRFGTAGFVPVHDMYEYPGDFPDALKTRDVQFVTGACVVTPRDLYLELGGLDEAYWNGYEDVDYCLKVRDRGLRIVYQGDAVVTHFESQSGLQRFRRVPWNSALLASRWNGKAAYDGFGRWLERGYIRREVHGGQARFGLESVPNVPVTVICHGPKARQNDAAYVKMLRANDARIERVLFVGTGRDAVQAAREATELRGLRYAAFVDTRCELREGWLDELLMQLEFGWTVGVATYAPELDAPTNSALTSADARCAAVALSKYPQHHRLGAFDDLHEAFADFAERGIALHRGIRFVKGDRASLPSISRTASADLESIEASLSGVPPRERGLVSIVMLSWNALEYTKIALDSIRRFTSGPYEIVIVDNGSSAETVAWLQTQQDVRLICNPVNRGYAAGNNQAIAAARGDFVVLLNNDVIVTEGWLDGLLGAFDRVPGIGISAPRSNKIAGDQLVNDAAYDGPDGLQEFARERARTHRRRGFLTDRAIGLCLCIDRRVIDEVGGLDERFGLGNFEDDDFSIRVRAAGYKIYVCDDVFIHHFGSQSFAANKVDYGATMHANWKKFAAKWGLPPEFPQNGYDLRPAIARGFDRREHYVVLPQAPESHAEPDTAYTLVIAAAVRTEREWNEIAPFVRRYATAFEPANGTLLAIAACGELDAQTLGARIERALARSGISPAAVADITVSDEDSPQEWLRSLGDVPAYRLQDSGIAELDALAELVERSPSALRRLIAARGAA